MQKTQKLPLILSLPVLSPMEIYSKETGKDVYVKPHGSRRAIRVRDLPAGFLNNTYFTFPGSETPDKEAPPDNDVITMKTWVTPSMADWLLSPEIHQHNRDISPPRIESLKGAMEEDKFPFVGDPIRLCITLHQNGTYSVELIDGQHRLDAMRKAQIAMWLNIVYYLSPEHRMFIDIGRVRSTADSLIHAFGFERARELCAWIRLISEVILKQGKIVTPMTVYTMVKTHLDSVNWVMKRFPKNFKCPASIKAAFLWAHATDPQRVDGIAEKFITGANLSLTDPILWVRKQFIFAGGDKKGKLDPKHGSARVDMIALILNGIGLSLDNQGVTQEISADNSALPLLTERFKAAWDQESLREPLTELPVSKRFKDYADSVFALGLNYPEGMDPMGLTVTQKVTKSKKNRKGKQGKQEETITVTTEVTTKKVA